MKEKVSLDRELLRNFMGSEKLGGTELPDEMEIASAEVEGDEENVKGKLRVFEENVAQLIKTYSESGGDTSKLTDDIIKGFNETTKGFEHSLLEENKTLLRKRIEDQLKKDYKKNNTSYRARALVIVEVISEVFENDLRSKISKTISASGVPDKKELYDSRLNDQKILFYRNLTRWALWVGSMYTSWLGISNAMSWAVERYLVEIKSSNIEDAVATASVMLGLPAAAAASEVIRRVKVAIEYVGATKNLGFKDSCLELARERKGYAIAFALLLFADIGTNIQGGYDWTLGRWDTEEQLNDAKEFYRQEIEGDDLVVTKDGEKVKSIKAQMKEMDMEMKDEASKQAMKALIGEVKGTHSTLAGVGPRVYGIASAYFGDRGFTAKKNTLVEGCNSSDKETYEGWELYKLENDSWCAVGVVNNRGITETWSFGVGPMYRAHGTPISILESRHGELYDTARSNFEEFRSTHSDSFVDAIDKRWDVYYAELQKVVDTQVEQVNKIEEDWDGNKDIVAAKVESNEQVYPALLKIQEVANGSLKETLTADLAAISKAYSDFDAKLVQDLDKNGKSVNIEPPAIKPINFDIKPANFEGLGPRNVLEKSLKLMAEHLSYGPALVAAVWALSGLFSYLDMIFFKAVKGTFQRDVERLRGMNAEFIMHIRELVEALNTHLNRGPFRKVYRPDSSIKDEIPEDFVRRRFEETVTKKSESSAHESIEKGLMPMFISRFVNRFKKKPKKFRYTLEEELAAAWRDFTGESSPILDAFFRLRDAILQYGQGGKSFTTGTMKLGNGENSKTVVEIIEELYESSPGTEQPEEFAERFRRVIWQRISRKPLKEIQTDGTFNTRVDKTIRQIEKLKNTINVQSEEWVLHLVEVSAQVENLLEENIVLDADKVKKEQLETAYKALSEKFDQELKNFENEAKKAREAFKERLAEQAADQEYQGYKQEFDRIRSLIDSARTFVGSVTLSSGDRNIVNVNTLIEKIDERISAINNLDYAIGKLKPLSNRCRSVKVDLKRDRDAAEDELIAMKTQSTGSLMVEVINRNRGLQLIKWVKEIRSKGEVKDKTGAQGFVEGFVDTYKKLFKGYPSFVDIPDGWDNKSLDKIPEAYSHFVKEVRHKEADLGFDAGANYQFDPAWHIGNQLKTSFEVLGLKQKITVPDGLRKQISTTI